MRLVGQSQSNFIWSINVVGEKLPDRIGTLVSMATDSSHRIIMGKNLVSTLVPSFLSGSSSYLQVKRTTIISRSSNFGQMRPRTGELAALEHLKKIPYTYNGRNVVSTLSLSFLAHLSQRPIGELIGYSWSGVRPSSSSSSSVRPSVVNNFKHLLLQNHLPNQSQILCGASLGKGKRKFVRGIWVTWPRWPPGPYMVKTLQKSSSPEPVGRFLWNLVCSIGDSSSS